MKERFTQILFFLRVSNNLQVIKGSKIGVFSNDYEIVSWPETNSQDLVHHQVNGFTSKGKAWSGWLALFDPSKFKFALPANKCGSLAATSATSATENCIYATNGGFFDIDTGACIGNIVMNNTVIQNVNTTAVLFGLLYINNHTNGTLIGYTSSSAIADEQLKFSYAINGRGWLVRNGKSYLTNATIAEDLDNSFIIEEAPRTTIGILKNGTHFLFQIDGEEDIRVGMNLHEITRTLLLDIDAYQAVNLDGGGSSVSVFNSTVISSPTCLDTSHICERNVSSIACIHD